MIIAINVNNGLNAMATTDSKTLLPLIEVDNFHILNTAKSIQIIMIIKTISL